MKRNYGRGLTRESPFFSEWEKAWPLPGMDEGVWLDGLMMAQQLKSCYSVPDMPVRILKVTRSRRGKGVDVCFQAHCLRKGLLVLVEFRDHAELSTRLSEIVPLDETIARIYFEIFDAMEAMLESDRAPGFDGLPALWALELLGAPDE